MNNIFKNLFLPFISVNLVACQAESQPASKWVSGMELKAYHGGGMNPQSETVIIKSDKSVYIYWRLQQRDTIYFILSQPERDSILAFMKSKGFSKMKSGSSGSIKYDAPTTSIEFISGNKTQEV